MKPIKLANGNLLVPRGSALPNGAGLADGLVEIGPDDPAYARWLKFLPGAPASKALPITIAAHAKNGRPA